LRTKVKKNDYICRNLEIIYSIMKTFRLFLMLFVLSHFCSVVAQEEFGNGLLLPNFEKGVVVFKNGTRSSSLLNYGLFQQEILFLSSDSMVMAIANPQDILVVIIGNRRFFPISGRVFYEEILVGEGSFFIHHKAKMFSEGKQVGYGGYSQTGSVQSLSHFQDGVSGGITKLNTSEKFKLLYDNSYYIKSGKNYKRFSSAKSLGKLFKGQESIIEKFAIEQSINFYKTDDIAKIVEYAFSLTSK